MFSLAIWERKWWGGHETTWSCVRSLGSASSRVPRGVECFFECARRSGQTCFLCALIYLLLLEAKYTFLFCTVQRKRSIEGRGVATRPS